MRNTCITHSRFAFFCLVTLILSLGVILSPMLVRAQSGYPARQDDQVNDFAQILTPDTTRNIQTLLANYKRDVGIEIVVVTIKKVSDYPVGDISFETFATHLFNAWGIGDGRRNDGVLLLIASESHKSRIEVGSGYGISLNAPMQAVTDQDMIPAFKRGDYDTGIYDGLKGIIRALDQQRGVVSNPAAANNNPLLILGIGVLGSLSLAGTALLTKTVLSHRCSQCHTKMLAQDASITESHLDEGQKREQQIGSVRYTFWECPKCHETALEHHVNARHGYRQCSQCRHYTQEKQDQSALPALLNEGQKLENGYGSVHYTPWKCLHCDHAEVTSKVNHLSSYKACPACKYHTLAEHDQTLAEATRYSTGLRLLKYDCSNCHYHSEREETIAALSHNDFIGGSWDGGSSGGSSGGGSSSGGGASGSW